MKTAESQLAVAIAKALWEAHSYASAYLQLRPTDVNDATDDKLADIMENVELAIATVRALLPEECP